MSDTWVPGTGSDRQQPAWLMYIACNAPSPPVRAWTGAANFMLGPCGPDTTGGLYPGLGLLVGVPSLKVPLNGAFAQTTFSLSGVDKAALALVLSDTDKAAVRYARISLARIELDEDCNPVAAPSWVWVAYVLTPRIVQDGDRNPMTRTVQLMCATGSPRRTVQSAGLWTGVQQRLIDPNDASCDLVPTYADGETDVWPN